MPRTDGAVCPYRGQPLFCHLDIEAPGLRFSGAIEGFVSTPTAVLFPSMAAWGDAVLVAGQGHTIEGAFGVILRPGFENITLGPDKLGIAVGANPVAVKGEGGGFKVAIVRSPTVVEILFITPGGDVSSLGFRAIPHTSQGITGWDGDTLLLGDPVQRLIAGRSLHEATKVGPWWIGQDSYANRIVLVNEQTGFAWTAYETRVGQRPRFVRLPDGRFAVTASDDGPVALVLEQPAQSDDTIGRPGDPPPPPPPPDEEEEPPPVSYTPIPSQLSVVEEVWHRCTPEQRARHAFVAEAVAWELRRKGLDFYVNQKRGVEGDSEDAISTPHPHGAGGWAIIDVVAGMGGDNPQPAWIDVTQATIDGGTVGGGRLPRNVLGVGGDDGDPGDEDDGKPQPACECAEQLEELRANQDAQHARIQELLEKVAALEQRPAPSLPKLRVRGGTSREWGHAHTIDLEVVPE